MYLIQYDLDPSNVLQGHVTILLCKVHIEKQFRRGRKI